MTKNLTNTRGFFYDTMLKTKIIFFSIDNKPFHSIKRKV